MSAKANHKYSDGGLFLDTVLEQELAVMRVNEMVVDDTMKMNARWKSGSWTKEPET